MKRAALDDPLLQPDTVSQRALQQALEMRRAVHVFRAFVAHLELQVGLMLQVDLEAVRGLGERAVIDDQVHPMRRTPDAEVLVGGFLGHQHHKST